MCVAVPAQIDSMEAEKAVVNLAGARAEVITTLTPEAKVGDWVLIHAGFTITLLDEADARETFAILRQAEEAQSE